MDVNLNVKITADDRVLGALAWIASIAEEQSQGNPVGTTRVETERESDTPDAPEPEPAEDEEPTAKPSITLDEIRSYCTELVRKDKSKRSKIKELLDEHDVDKIPALAPHQLDDFWKAVQQL